jgi:hypothetical protein
MRVLFFYTNRYSCIQCTHLHVKIHKLLSLGKFIIFKLLVSLPYL